MAAASLSQAISTVLSIALVTSGGTSGQSWRIGEMDYQVAVIQAQLGVLGFDAGPVTGEMTGRTLKSADEYVATFGLRNKSSLGAQLGDTIALMGTVPASAHGALILSVEADLKSLGLYAGPLDGQWSPRLGQAVRAFQNRVGQSQTGTLTAATLSEVAHWTAVAVAASHHWPYQAQSGDTLALLAWAAHLPFTGFTRANNSHGTEVLAGQAIQWRTAKPPAPQASKPPAPAPPPPAAASAPTGVLANLDPVSDLVLVQPTTSEVNALITAESTNSASIDVALTGQWALLHPDLVKALAQLGNEIAVTGYTGQSLNSLPPWGVTQELNWAVHAVSAETGTAPTFLLSMQKPLPSVDTAAHGANLVVMSPSLALPAGSSPASTTGAVEQALLGHANQIVALTGAVDWATLFQQLAAKHFVFETLGQIWANQ